MTPKERAERIREEILKAKEVAGLNPPRLVPRGDAFRSATSSRPCGATSRELDMPQLRGALNDDVIPTVSEPEKLSKAMIAKLGKPNNAVLCRVEQALELMEEGKVSPQLCEAVASHLNMFAALGYENKSVAGLRERFDTLRYSQVSPKDLERSPGGGAPNG